jgi:Tol biopolymer transport system component
VISPDTKRLRPLTSFAADHPSWSPDGRQLAFDNGRRIGIVDANGKHVKFLTKSKQWDTDPAWSPDGRTIAFTRSPTEDSAKHDIWVMTAAGADQRLLLKNGREPAWRPR